MTTLNELVLGTAFSHDNTVSSGEGLTLEKLRRARDLLMAAERDPPEARQEWEIFRVYPRSKKRRIRKKWARQLRCSARLVERPSGRVLMSAAEYWRRRLPCIP